MVGKGFSHTWARAAAGLGFCLLAAQVWIAGLVGGVRRDGDRPSASDPSFVGGAVGLPGRDRTMLSAAWDEETVRVQLARRETVRRSGARARGIVVAALFGLVGLDVVSFASSASAPSSPAF